MTLQLSTNLDTPNPFYGGKANHLISVKQSGFRVPKFIVIPADFLATLIPSDAQSPIDFILSFKFPSSFLSEVFSNFINDKFVAIRSSALNEDGLNQSFAGQYETKLYVTQNTLNDALVAVWASAFSNKVIAYSRQQNASPLGMAIIVQSMIDADVAGVAFSTNPITGNANETTINAVWGLGEGIVSGELNADLYLVNNGTITTQIAEKQWAYSLNKAHNHGTIKESVNSHKVRKACLSESQILEIDNSIKLLSAQLKTPQDIEFAYRNSELYLLQARPITAIVEQNTESATIWDNSNIVESYPELTLPLTFSFITKMYEAVYTQLSGILGISKKVVDNHKEVYANMLGLLWGRVYYNLSNWHKSLSLLPGYKLNASFMDNMMGVKEKFDTPMESINSKWNEWWRVLVAVAKIVKAHNSIKKNQVAFQHYFNTVMNTYSVLNFEKMPLQELTAKYFLFEHTLVKKWDAPLINDFFCMIYFGVLQKLVVKYQIDDSGTLHNDLVSGANDIISTEPIKLSLSIIALIQKSEEATIIFQNDSPEAILEKLWQPQFAEINDAIQGYIKKWGERSVGELKLETITYRQQPERFIKILKNLLKTQNIALHPKENTLRHQAESIVSLKLKNKPVKRLIFSYVLKKARYLVSNRENLRFERTRAFGMVRIMMLSIGKKWAINNLLEHERDIFYLTQKEIFDYINGSSIHVDLKALVVLRKREYVNYEKVKLPERIKSKGSIYNFSIKNEVDKDELEVTSILRGVGCSSGIVVGKVCIVHAPHEIDSLNNQILVTASTDPGWVVLFPSAAAILVERGSLLSHSAIVSREMGIPCIVGLSNLLNIVKSGDLVEIDGKNGTVKILTKA